MSGRPWLAVFCEQAFPAEVSRVSLLPEAPLPPHQLARRVRVLSHRRGLRYGAPTLREGQVLARAAGDRAPLVRFLAVLADEVQLLAGALGRGLRAHDEERHVRVRALATALAIATDVPAVVDAPPGPLKDRALAKLGRALDKRRYLYGNPLLGLTLNHALTAAEARTFAEAAPFCVGEAPVPALRDRIAADARARRAALVACIASLSAHRHDLDDRLSQAAERWQIRSLGLPRDETGRLLDLVKDPPDAEACAALVPPGDAAFVVEHTVLAARIDGRVNDDERDWIDELCARLWLDVPLRARLERRVEAFVQAHRDLFNPLDHAERFLAARPPMGSRAARAIRLNLDALLREIRETGDLALLLARRASGQELSRDEQKRMRAQLVDVAKAVPGLAVFTLPGGIVLLPVLMKLLPFDLRTSAFQQEGFRAFEAEDDSLEEAADGGEIAEET